MNDRDHPFLRPLWRRAALVGVCGLWTAFESYNGDQLWSTIALGMTVYGAWTYLWSYKEPVTPPPGDGSEDKP